MNFSIVSHNFNQQQLATEACKEEFVANIFILCRKI